MPLPPGMCQSWTPIGDWTCDLPTGSAPFTGTALELASELLWARSGRQFGICDDYSRPCRRSCFTTLFDWNQSYPTPILHNGQWLNLACGTCVGDCSCSRISEVALPGPVVEVTQVKVDGVVLVPEVDYRVDDWRLLVRLNGEEWPICNNLNLPDTAVGTWSVTWRRGVEVPSLGNLAVTILAKELVRMLMCDPGCELPMTVQSLSRQGVNMTFIDPNTLFDDNRIGLYLPDLFIKTYNPYGLRSRPKVYDIDGTMTRRHINT